MNKIKDIYNDDLMYNLNCYIDDYELRADYDMLYEDRTDETDIKDIEKLLNDKNFLLQLKKNVISDMDLFDDNTECQKQLVNINELINKL